jgi:hypothetical protein
MYGENLSTGRSKRTTANSLSLRMTAAAGAASPRLQMRKQMQRKVPAIFGMPRSRSPPRGRDSDRDRELWDRERERGRDRDRDRDRPRYIERDDRSAAPPLSPPSIPITVLRDFP